MIFNMECAVVLVVIGTILSPSLTTPSAGVLTDLFPSGGLCDLTTEGRLKVQRHLQNAVPIIDAGGVAVPECGPGPWLQIADFDFSSATDPCPPEWELVTAPAGRGGCRQLDTAAGCTVATFSTNGVEYGKVCGQIIGAATGNPDAFRELGAPGPTVAANGVRLIDGVTITYSSEIQHIWTLSAARFTNEDLVVCPCKTNTNSIIMDAVAFADNNYFCDTTFGNSKLLWNGDCTPITIPSLEACCEFNTPPFFTAPLPTRTTANVDAHLCRDQARSDEDIRVQIIQLYVQ